MIFGLFKKNKPTNEIDTGWLDEVFELLGEDKMKEISAPLAGEMSGHIFFSDRYFGYDDGINSAIQVCHLLDNQSKTMFEIINELPNTFQTPTMAPFCKDEELSLIHI